MRVMNVVIAVMVMMIVAVTVIVPVYVRASPLA
jgi:hypothetical protein